MRIRSERRKGRRRRGKGQPVQPGQPGQPVEAVQSGQPVQPESATAAGGGSDRPEASKAAGGRPDRPEAASKAAGGRPGGGGAAAAVAPGTAGRPEGAGAASPVSGEAGKEAGQSAAAATLAPPPDAPLDPRRAERVRRAAAMRRMQEQRRERARRLADEEAAGLRRPRSALVALVVTLGMLIAAVALTGALIVTSRQHEPVRLAAPLHVYPVSQVTVGACAAGVQGITGQTATGPVCYQLTNGIAIRRVEDLAVQQGQTAGTHDVAMSLRDADRKAFADLTRSTVGRSVAFVVRNQLVTAPRVDMPITEGKIVITGQFTRADADRLVRTLRGS